jgi:prepilin-type N-terminal cleavage/methylation domain-containing protein
MENAIANQFDFRHSRGFTLVELMFAILIIAISVLALYQMFVQGSLIQTEEYHRRIGLQQARSKLETARYFETELDSVPRHMEGTFREQLVPPEQGQVEGIQAVYTIRVVPGIHRNRNGVPLNYIVSITYSWTERSGREQVLTMGTGTN